MKRIITILNTLLLTAVLQADVSWQSDFSKARERAIKEKKPMLINFTGSDWCGWCIKMKKDVLTDSKFVEYAEKNLVLVEADFPNSKPQTPALKASNEILKKKYLVQGFPTFVLIDADGKELGRHVGYIQGGAGAFTSKLDGYRAASQKSSARN